MRTEKILIVEDDEDIRITTSQILTSEGYQLESSANGKEAIEVLERENGQFDLILLDLMMPVMDGYELIAILENSTQWKTIPVLIMSADTRAKERLPLLKKYPVLQKPLELDELLEQVEYTLKNEFGSPAELSFAPL